MQWNCSLLCVLYSYIIGRDWFPLVSYIETDKQSTCVSR
jgi:hypothetical protein